MKNVLRKIKICVITGISIVLLSGIHAYALTPGSGETPENTNVKTVIGYNDIEKRIESHNYKLLSQEIAYDKLYNNPESSVDEISNLKKNMQETKDLLVSQAKSNFILYKQSVTGLKQDNVQIDKIKSQIRIAKKKFELGLITKSDVDELEDSLGDAMEAYTTRIEGGDDILNQLKTAFGMNIEDELILGDIPYIEKQFVDRINVNTDMELFLVNSVALKDRIKEAEDNESLTREQKNYEITSKKAELKTAFISKYKKLKEMNSALRISEKKLKSYSTKYKKGELKYKIGLISKSELVLLKDDVKSQEDSLDSSFLSLMGEIESYKSLRDGI